ncbi:unnamed protein product [Tenebrio molitor]|nr:unnamed protein product [Tenebrio molitor]
MLCDNPCLGALGAPRSAFYPYQVNDYIPRSGSGQQARSRCHSIFILVFLSVARFSNGIFSFYDENFVNDTLKNSITANTSAKLNFLIMKIMFGHVFG